MIKTVSAAMVAAVLGLSGLAFAQQQRQQSTEARPMWVYIGTAGGTAAKGIYVSRFDAATGRLTTPELAAESRRATYVWPLAGGKVLLGVDQVEQDGKQVGMLRSYAIEGGTGGLVELNAQPTGGAGPCYVSTDREGRYALVANYTAGSVAVLPVRGDGKLEPASAMVKHEGSGPNAKRQDHAYAHCFDFDPAERFALSCDLGSDRIEVYQFDIEHGRLTAMEPGRVAPGSGPRHLAFGPGGKFVYVVNEMGSTITAFAYDASTGRMTPGETVSTLPSDYGQSDKDTAAEVFLHPSGKFLYASNRGHDSVVRFAVDAQTGKLSEPRWTKSGGTVPRYFGIDPSGKWMLIANQGSGDIRTFAMSAEDGSLTPTGDVVRVTAPTCMKFVAGE